jgi:Tfp pilus assembly protein PilF
MENSRISHYEVGRRLGRGGMGEVYEALDRDLDRRVALKFVAPELAADPEALKRFEREARAAAALHHPHIATLFAFERDGGRTFIAMELVTGESLRERIARGPLPVAEALAIARDVAGALAFAHRRGITHRDVKPENLMFDGEGAIKLMDFGLARAVQASRMTMTGSTLGTAAYMAPESARGAGGPPSDVFALGVVLHEMLAGELPFAGDSPLALLFVIANEAPRPLRAARPDVPDAVAALVARTLEKDAGARIDAAAAARELAALTGAPAPAASSDTEELDATRVASAGETPAPTDGTLVAARKPPRPRAPAVLLLGLLALAVGIAGWMILSAPGGRGNASERAIALNNRGMDLMAADSLAAARAQFEAALRADPRFGRALFNLAYVRMRAGEDTEASTLFERVLREQPGDSLLAGRAHGGLGDIDMRSRALPSAIGHYGAALALDSTTSAYPNNLGFALIDAGRPDEAVPILERAITRFPGEAMLHKNLGLARLRSDDPAGAIRALHAALDRDPGLASAWALRAEARARSGDRTGARADWQTYLNMEHDEAERPGIEAQLRRLGALAGGGGESAPASGGARPPLPPPTPGDSGRRPRIGRAGWRGSGRRAAFSRARPRRPRGTDPSHG